MKKIIALLLTLVMAFAVCLPLTACSNGNKESKVMTVELNPQVEFLLDANNKVISVNAINDEGNYVIAKAEFIGKTADEAVNAFLKISVEDGFLLEGEVNAGKNNVKISISGEDAQKIYDEVTKKAKEYIEKLPDTDIDVKFNFGTITKEDLEKLVGDCMRELDPENIKAKTQAELLKLLEQSRKETEDLLSQELKDYYYAERALEIRKAQLDAYIEAVKTQDTLGVVSAALTAAQQQLKNVLDAINHYKEIYKTKLLDKTSEYYVKMQEVIAAKKELLEARLKGATEETLQALDTAYQSALQLLESAKEFAKASIDTANKAFESTLTIAKDAIDTIVKSLNIAVKDLQKTIDKAIEETKKNFEDAFNKENLIYINNNYWTALTPSNEKTEG